MPACFRRLPTSVPAGLGSGSKPRMARPSRSVGRRPRDEARLLSGSRPCGQRRMPAPSLTAALRQEKSAAVADGSVHNIYQAFNEPARRDSGPGGPVRRALLHEPAYAVVLEDWMQEVVAGPSVAILCGCRYAKEHHGANLMSLLGDAWLAGTGRCKAALEAGEVPSGADARLRAITRGAHTRKLTDIDTRRDPRKRPCPAQTLRQRIAGLWRCRDLRASTRLPLPLRLLVAHAQRARS